MAITSCAGCRASRSAPAWFGSLTWFDLEGSDLDKELARSMQYCKECLVG